MARRNDHSFGGLLSNLGERITLLERRFARLGSGLAPGPGIEIENSTVSIGYPGAPIRYPASPGSSVDGANAIWLRLFRVSEPPPSSYRQAEADLVGGNNFGTNVQPFHAHVLFKVYNSGGTYIPVLVVDTTGFRTDSSSPRFWQRQINGGFEVWAYFPSFAAVVTLHPLMWQNETAPWTMDGATTTAPVNLSTTGVRITGQWFAMSLAGGFTSAGSAPCQWRYTNEGLVEMRGTAVYDSGSLGTSAVNMASGLPPSYSGSSDWPLLVAGVYAAGNNSAQHALINPRTDGGARIYLTATVSAPIRITLDGLRYRAQD